MRARTPGPGHWLALAAGTVGIARALPSLAITIPLSCTEPARTIPLAGPDREIVVVPDGGRGWVELGESGQQIDVDVRPPGPTLRISRPLRLGWYWVEPRDDTRITVRRTEASHATGSLTVAQHCSPSIEQTRYLDWLRGLGTIDLALEAPPGRANLDELLTRVVELEKTAPDARAEALGVHYRAQLLFVANEFAAAAEEFGRAERRWRSFGDAERAFAARVGRIEAEGRAGALARVLEETEATAKGNEHPGYFESRLLNERCLALEQLGEMALAVRCYQDTLAMQLELGELPEHASTSKNFANLLRKRGDLVQAEAVAARALAIASGPYAPLVRGRLHLLLAEIDRQRGNAGSALQHIELADAELEHAGSDALFSRGAARLAEARLLEQVGAYYEAYSALAAAAALWPPQESLALRARIFADIEADTRHFDSALFWYRASEQLYAANGETPARDATRLGRLRLAVRLGDTDEAERALAERRQSPQLYAPQWQLLAAQAALARGDLERARRALDAVRGSPLALTDQIAYAVADAEYAVRAGNERRAQDILADAVQHVHTLAARVDSPVLGYVVGRQSETLRRSAYQHLLDDVSADLDADWPSEVVRLFEIAPPSRSRPAADDSAGHHEAIDETIATELLATPMASAQRGASPGQHQLLAILAGSQAGRTISRPEAAADLGHLQQALDPGAVMLAYLAGEDRAAFLCITRDAATLVQTAAPDELRANIVALDQLLHRADSSVAQIELQARRLSAVLLGNLPGAPPSRLYVLADPEIDAVPWSILYWPESVLPLIDSTAISIAQLAHASPAPPVEPAALHVLIAAQDRAGTHGLPALMSARAEARRIEPAVAARSVRVEVNSAPTRAAVLDALAEPGAWVHIAAHGAAEPRRIGYAGIWLEPGAHDVAPPFLSWLDLLDSAVQAGLVVLNACRLGDGGLVLGANMSFAAAVVRAGARHVVAAAWPVSDSASAFWVPAFYSALLAEAHGDPARALRAAQLRLRDSRAFRHPFFWASLRAFERFQLAPFSKSQSQF